MVIDHCVAIAVYWVATTCHLPLGIFTQVSVQRANSAKGFPASVPVPLYLAVAMPVIPNTVTFRSSFSALVYLRALALSRVWALLRIVPSIHVQTYFSA